ncbi:MAG: response regulator transcription factor [Clostridiales bacterium]|nr:response regulator transcription factor [Clostridiales bacterium]
MPESKPNVLVVEDDKNISDFLAAILTSNGYGVMCASEGKKAISMTADNRFDVILLDLGLPDLDGIKVLKSIREWSNLPIIVVSAREDELEKVEALDAGADDYVTKPFGNNELLARIRTTMRVHRRAFGDEAEAEPRYSADGLNVDYERRRITKHGASIHLTPIEYKIVVLLSQSAGKVLTRDYIITRVWGEHYDGDDQILRVNMANIRRKLEDNPADPRYILTEVGVGYRMIEEGAE